MAKKSMILKQQAEPKFSTRRYNRCKICGRPHAYLRDYGVCRICFSKEILPDSACFAVREHHRRNVKEACKWIAEKNFRTVHVRRPDDGPCLLVYRSCCADTDRVRRDPGFFCH